MALITCPECRQPAEVMERFILGSTAGRLERVNVRCRAGHWFTVPSDHIA